VSTAASERRPSAAAVALALAAILAGCGGGGTTAPPATTVSAGPGCELAYTLTDSPVLTGADPFLDQQWHLRNVGQSGGTAGEDLRARDAWPLSRGAGVRVAVVDDAVEIVHADLTPNVVPGASRSYRAGNRGSPWPLPCVAATDDHGTAVAGLVLARDDNLVGGAGVAPRASLVAFDALASGADGDIADALLRDGQDNAIYQNSWGSPDDGVLHSTPPSYAAAIASGIAAGRGGRGSIYVFPGGNGGCFVRESSTGTCQSDNANFDGFVNRLGIIAVCAVDDQGRRPRYGEQGANLLVCAPSSTDANGNVTTTALRGGMRADFSGTSASTPMVSGVVALMLAANPELTWRDVRLILAQSARRNDPADPGWTPGPGGLNHNHAYGFGVADARAAVALASGWRSVGGSAAMKTCTVSSRAPGLPIPDATGAAAGAPVTDRATVAGCDIAQIEFVEVTLSAAHTYSGDLRVTLSSPAGQVSVLANSRICATFFGTNQAQQVPCGNYEGWTFGSARHMNEAANGAWTLAIADEQAGDVGTFDRWSLKLYGR
jgi:subtilisin-like proprotein convertase family protein